MKRYYWLPEAERDNNCVYLRRIDLVEHTGQWAVTITPGTATAGVDGEPDPDTFVGDGDIPERGETVQEPARFAAWLTAQPVTTEDAEQHFVGGLMKYLWLQRKGLLPNE